MKLVSEYYALLQEHVDRESKAIASGRAKTYEEYSRRVGIINGLAMAANILTELVKTKPGEERI